jgi:hypothetical protein
MDYVIIGSFGCYGTGKNEYQVSTWSIHLDKKYPDQKA